MDYGQGSKLEEIFASALEDWSKTELMRNGISSIWDRIVEAISKRGDTNKKSMAQSKTYGKTIDKMLFESEYLLADTYVKFGTQEETKKIFDEHIQMQKFDADGFRNNPMLEDELKSLREAMSKDGASSYHFTICVAVDQSSLQAFNKARHDLRHLVDLNKLAKEKTDWKAYLVDGYHRISVLLEGGNSDKFPFVMRVIWLRPPTPEFSWQVREYADTLNRVARVQPSFSVKTNSNPWFQIQIIESNISRIVEQFIEAAWPNTEILQPVRQKFIENVDNRQLYMLPTGQVILRQYCNDATSNFTTSTIISDELKKPKKLTRPELLRILGEIRPEMFGIEENGSVSRDQHKLAEKVGIMVLMIVFMKTLKLASCSAHLADIWSKLCMKEKLWSLLERSMTKTCVNGKRMHGWCLEFTPWLTLKPQSDLMNQTSLERICFVAMTGVRTEDDIFDSRQLVEESCTQDFLAFLKMLLVLPSPRHDLVAILLMWRKVVLWLQAIHNCLLRGVGNFQYYCQRHATNYRSNHMEFINGTADSFKLNDCLRTVLVTLGNYFCERLFSPESCSFASDSESSQTIRFQDCPLLKVSDTELQGWHFEIGGIDEIFGYIDEAYDDLDSFQRNEDNGAWDVIKHFWKQYYVPAMAKLLKMIQIPDQHNESHHTPEKARSSSVFAENDNAVAGSQSNSPPENADCRSSAPSENADSSFEVSEIPCREQSEEEGKEENKKAARKRKRKRRRFSAIQIEREARTLEEKLEEEVVRELEKEFANVTLEGDQLKRVGSRIVDLLVNSVTRVFKSLDESQSGDFVVDDDDNASDSSENG